MIHSLICCAGTFVNHWSKWLEYQLEELKPFFKSCLRNSQQFVDRLKPLYLPPHAKVFTADTNLMHNNVDTDYSINVISWWLDKLAPKLTNDFPINAVKFAMHIIMQNNILNLESSVSYNYWEQL